MTLIFVSDFFKMSEFNSFALVAQQETQQLMKGVMSHNTIIYTFNLRINKAIMSDNEIIYPKKRIFN